MNVKQPTPFHAVAILALLVLVVVSSGCINKLQNTLEPTPTPSIPPSGQDTIFPNESPGSQTSPVQPQVTFREIVPSKSSAVEEVAPHLTPDPYPIIHGTQLNQTLKEDPVYSGPYEFEKTYIFRGNATGLRVNVAEGPLYLIYIVTPQNDCLLSPDTCRGDKAKSVNRPYLTITVRDNQTHEIIAEDGYGREYSSDTGNYEFILESKNTMDGLLSSGGAIGTNTVSPGPRVLKVFQEGTFDITFEGNFLDIDLKVKTGATPSGTNAGSAPSPAPEIPEEEERW